MGEDRRSFSLVSKSPDETLRIGKVIGARLGPGDVVALVGELGSGKTVLTQGIAQGIPVDEGYVIASPTFTLINEYPGRYRLYHLDIYRLEGSEDLLPLGYEDYFYGDGIVVIEWAEKILDILPEETLFVRLRYLDEERREIEIEGFRRRVDGIEDALKEGGFF
ncbi:MAG TPA: tRNA (adenosine(37)-N6)-threonylcarbamoyltransferase complex ATPase subunit type 1 TsaE [Syntrophales bacterium]|nr:tRNA (adenosine(37)-N6)-threonylcarbamoyltransferase complex ATPase subunit type 1 TsaE [Syntrophales bacterium]HRT27001.1 tRNA (adenosine(37)-N6)-threonylcarbamoyltransferase complex ATPase subunit type 1 TsaE [Syntrophales bacterium]HRT69885.1 tRNA (adenosine(37)-N6)-threonylcarbamoyltransferase complex ATPase subunit type 1 TsaE [Syntrophales bacterium]